MYLTKLTLNILLVIVFGHRSIRGGYLENVEAEIYSCELSLRPILIKSPTDTDVFGACEIKVINNPVKVLAANMFSNLEGLLKLKFENSSTEEVQSNFLNNVTNLVTLSIKLNNISTIKNNVFSNTNIKYLWLNFNGIKKIETKAFDNMTSLTLLDLSYNFLKTIDGQWFRNVSNLRRISFIHNLLTEINEDTLQHLQGADLTVMLGYNQISKISSRAFKNQTDIDRIELQSNKITWISDEFFKKFTRLGQLNLNRNNISCLVENADVLKPVHNLFLKDNDLRCDCVKKLQLFMKVNYNFIQLEYRNNCFNFFD